MAAGCRDHGAPAYWADVWLAGGGLHGLCSRLDAAFGSGSVVM
jgi:hypothetical protein